MKSLWELRVFCAVVERKACRRRAPAGHLAQQRHPRGASAGRSAGQQPAGALAKQLSLTLAGESYYTSARKMLDLQEEAEDELAAMSEAPRGLLRFSAPEAMSHALLPPVLARMADTNPELRFDVLYSDTILDPIREKLDFSIRGAFPASSELIGYPLWDYQRHLYASPAYVERHGAPQTPEQLPEHRVLIHSAPRVLKAWNFVSAGHQVSLNLTPWHRVSSGSAVLHAVQSGLGIARMGDWLAEPLVRAGQLLRLCPDYRIVSSHGDNPQMHAVFASRRIPRKARLLLEAVRAAARDAGHDLNPR